MNLKQLPMVSAPESSVIDKDKTIVRYVYRYGKEDPTPVKRGKDQ